MENYSRALRQALAAEVRRRARRHRHPPVPDGMGAAFARRKHIFHNTKRETVGLPHTRRREWMLDIDFRKREPFAYACEVYSRILEQSTTPAQRRALLAGYAEDPILGEERVDTAEHLDILTEAVGARNGWKRILSRCAAVKRRSSRALTAGAIG